MNSFQPSPPIASCIESKSPTTIVFFPSLAWLRLRARLNFWMPEWMSKFSKRPPPRCTTSRSSVSLVVTFSCRQINRHVRKRLTRSSLGTHMFRAFCAGRRVFPKSGRYLFSCGNKKWSSRGTPVDWSTPLGSIPRRITSCNHSGLTNWQRERRDTEQGRSAAKWVVRWWVTSALGVCTSFNPTRQFTWM